MGLFDSIISSAKSITSKIDLSFLNKVEGNLQQNPLKAATLATGILNAPGLIAGISTAAKVSTPAVSAAIATSSPFAVKTLQSVGTVSIKAATNPIATAKVAAGGLTTLAAGSLLISSQTAQRAVTSAPSSAINFGSNLGSFIDNPSVSSAKTIVSENPFISAAVGTAIVAGTTALVGNVINARSVVATKANTAAEVANTEAATAAQLAISALQAQPSQTTATTPALPVLNPITSIPAAPPAPVAKKAKKVVKKKKKKVVKKKKKKVVKKKKKTKKYIKKKKKKRK